MVGDLQEREREAARVSDPGSEKIGAPPDLSI